MLGFLQLRSSRATDPPTKAMYAEIRIPGKEGSKSPLPVCMIMRGLADLAP
jgi:hypothetical protein